MVINSAIQTAARNLRRGQPIIGVWKGIKKMPFPGFDRSLRLMALAAALTLALSVFTPVREAAHLATQNAPLRSTDSLRFSMGWYFRLGEYERPGGGQAMGTFEQGPGWDPIDLPHSFNAQNTFVPVRGYYRGIGWYRKHFTLSPEQASRKVFLEFGAAYSVADLWVNEHHLGQYMGGYTGFSADATEFVNPGDNLVGVKVTNVHDPDVLPGKDIPDYDLYGGLYRKAALVIKNRLYIPQFGIRVATPQVSESAAVIHVAVRVHNDYTDQRTCTAKVQLLDPAGKIVTEKVLGAPLAPGAEKILDINFDPIPNPALWSVDTPRLYSAYAQLADGATPSDEDTATFGLRWYQFKVDNGFFLNGKRLQLRGMNRHQDYPGLGNALLHRLQVRDVEILKETGVNFVRLSHYPQHPVFLDTCDRLGVLVYEEIATWQYIGGEQFMRNAEAMMRQMIARDANHPSIILWGLMNEGRSRPMFERLQRVARASDPTRLTVYAENNPDEGKKLGTVDVPDVLGINYETNHIDQVHALLPNCKLVTSEHSNAGARRGDLDAEMKQIDQVKANLDILESRRYMAGSSLWCMHDYGTDYWPVWPEQHSGALDSTRLPKELWYYLKSRWTQEPMVHLCGHWTWPGEEGKPRVVTVVTNCPSVELFLGGSSQGVRKGEDPMRWSVVYAPSALKAVGSCGGGELTDELRPAGPPAKMEVDANPSVIEVIHTDVTELTVSVRDAQGTLVPISGEVHFEVAGPGMLRGIGGAPAAKISAGVGRMLLQSATKPGEITVRAIFENLPPAVVTVTSR
jgi:beta-galactosidase